MRIWFSGEDLARTRLAAGPSPLIETLLSGHRPCCLAQREIVLGPWQRPTSAVRRGLLDVLCTRPKAFPDFVFEPPDGGPMPQYLEMLAAVSRTTLAASVVDLAGDGRVPPALRLIADGDRGTMRALLTDLRA